MHFEISASIQAIHKHLTTAQRNSSLFSEAPRIGVKTLRRGQVLNFSEAEFKAQEVQIKRLFDAGAIEVFMVEGHHRTNLRTVKKEELVQDTAKVDAPPPVVAPIVEVAPIITAPSPIPVQVAPTVESSVTELVASESPVATSSETMTQESLKHSKKGRK